MYGYGAWNPTLSYPQPFLHPEAFAMQGFHPGAMPIPWQNPFIAAAMFRNPFQQNPYLQTPLTGFEFAGLNPAIGSRPVPIGFAGSPEVVQGGAGAGFSQPAF